MAKELFRNMYAAKDRRAAHQALIRFYTHCAERHHVPELVTLAGTVSAWKTQILAYHDTSGASNGPTEAVNLLTEKTRRIGHGFRSFTNYQLRLLLACGVTWETPPVERIRRQQRRSAA